MRSIWPLILLTLTALPLAAGPRVLINASYDPTRAFYAEYNAAFAKHWQATQGQAVLVKQSHGGSGKQARSVMDGLPADVVTLALGYDIDKIAREGRLPLDWQERLPSRSAPYTSTIVFLVRHKNPKSIRDWGDLARPDVAVVTPSPKTSGGARWNYLAAWAWALKQPSGNPESAKALLAKIYKNVSVLDSGARAATTTFAVRGIGDVLVTWENEAYLAKQELGTEGFEVITPSISILAEPSVALVEEVARKKGNLDIAQAYLQHLYSDEAQGLAGKHYYRPRSTKVAKAYAKQFPSLKLVTVDEAFGGWQKAQKEHFEDGGSFDQIYR